jgi:hypothetical protein
MSGRHSVIPTAPSSLALALIPKSSSTKPLAMLAHGEKLETGEHISYTRSLKLGRRKLLAGRGLLPPSENNPVTIGAIDLGKSLGWVDWLYSYIEQDSFWNRIQLLLQPSVTCTLVHAVLSTRD